MDSEVRSAKKATASHARSLSKLIGEGAFRTAGGVCSQQFCTLVDLNALCELDRKLAADDLNARDRKLAARCFSDRERKAIKISRPTMKFCRQVLPAHVSSIQELLIHPAA